MDSQHPQKIELIGDYLAFVWSDGNESMIDASTLRENSQAEQVGNGYLWKDSRWIMAGFQFR